MMVNRNYPDCDYLILGPSCSNHCPVNGNTVPGARRTKSDNSAHAFHSSPVNDTVPRCTAVQLWSKAVDKSNLATLALYNCRRFLCPGCITAPGFIIKKKTSGLRKEVKRLPHVIYTHFTLRLTPRSQRSARFQGIQVTIVNQYCLQTMYLYRGNGPQGRCTIGRADPMPHLPTAPAVLCKP